MKCTDFELRLQCLFDERGTLGGDAELQAHALTCAECQSLVETYELLFDGVKARAVERRAFAEECVELAARGSDASEPVAPTRSYRVMPWVTAAAVLLAVGLTVRSWQQPVVDRGEENLPAQSVVAVAPITQPTVLVSTAPVQNVSREAVEAETVAPALGELVATDVPPAEPSLELVDEDALGFSFLETPADEYAGLYRATGRNLAMMLRSIRPMHTEAANSVPVLVEPVNDDSARGSWRRLHHSIEPLTDSMTEALEVLLRGKPVAPPAGAADRAS